jgi:hypothetical protein
MASTTSIDTETLRCPTCRASQPWSDACRRCKSDLRLLRDFAEGFEQSRRACLDHLQRGRLDRAKAAATRCLEISPDETSRRLMALVALQAGDWPAAAALAGDLGS